jgi:1-aminocyclopropane-1-carboxylate deaminase
LDFFEWKSESQVYPFSVQRDDRIHPIVSGNKSRKLRGWLQTYFRESYEGIVTFGGAFSNHLIATASVCYDMKIPCTGLVRGDEGVRNHYLDFCVAKGMELIYVSRTAYREKQVLSDNFKDYLGRRNLVIPEGGRGELGLSGFEELVHSWKGDFPDVVVHASATGTTAAGLARALKNAGATTRVLAVLVLRNEAEQMESLREWGISDEVGLISDYHFGGYAKTPASLLDFLGEARAQLDLPLEPVYTGKAFYALVHRILPEYVGKRVCFLHTGGIMNYEL